MGQYSSLPLSPSVRLSLLCITKVLTLLKNKEIYIFIKKRCGSSFIVVYKII